MTTLREPGPMKDAAMREPGSMEEAPMALHVRNGNAERAHALTTRELLGEIVDKAALLARKEVDLARTEIKADLQSQIALAKGLAVAAVAGLLGLNMLLVAAVIAVAPYVAPWLAALVLGGGLIAVGALVACVSWARRVSHPLALTRKTLKEDVQWAKEQLA